MKTILRTTLSLLLLTFSLTSHAGILIDPYLGFAIGGVDETGLTANNAKYDYSRPTYGARLGYQTFGFMAGVDYSMASGDWESKNLLVKEKLESSASALGVFAGFNLPILLRFWGTYYLNASSENKSSTATETLNGSGYGLGLGFTGLPFISLNLEYRSFSYDEVEASSGTHSLPSTTAGVGEHAASEVLLSVSLPLDLL
jgi:hypothetical protein